MGQAIADVLPFGIGVALSPAAIIAVVLMLGDREGRVNASVFLAAWVVGLAVVATVALLLADVADADSGGSAADWISGLKLIVGVALLALAAYEWHTRPRSDARPEPPTWLQKVATFTPSQAAGMALLLTAVKPKNLLLAIGAGIAIAETGANAGAQVIAVGVFLILGALGPGVPVTISIVMRDQADGILGSLRDWLIGKNAAIMVVLCLVIAAKLIGDAASTLAG